MNGQLKRLIRQVAGHPIVERILRGLVKLCLRLNPKLSEGMQAVGPEQCMQFSLVVDGDIAKLLDAIPSETSPRERRFLYRFFSTIWNGEGDVIEIGPFLGGTTRAIGLGMCNNPKVSENARLITCDRFCGYYDLPRLKEHLSPLIATGILDQSDLDGTGDSVEFMDIFKKIHAGYDYSRRILASDKTVPDRPEDLRNGKNYFGIEEDTRTSAVFIDGCKSWFGTKYFMSEVCRAAQPGAYFIFQDYGWYTCFWIPVFIESLRDYFQLIGYVDTTYAFVLTKSLDSEMIGRHFPDYPSECGEDRFNAIFGRLIEDATSRNDSFAAIRHTLQHAGALAYIGNKSKARTIISEVRKHPRAAAHKRIIEAASRSPTYSPDGVILLDPEASELAP